MTRPWSMTTMSCASWSASSRYWVVSSTAVPSVTSSLIIAHTSFLLYGSRPVVGSSRYSTPGPPTGLGGRAPGTPSAAAARVHAPPHPAGVRLRRPAGRVGEFEPGEQLGRAGPRLGAGH